MPGCGGGSQPQGLHSALSNAAAIVVPPAKSLHDDTLAGV